MDYDDLITPKVTLTANEVLLTGLKLVNFMDGHITRVKNKSTNVQRFVDHFGCNPFIAAQIFEDLQTSNAEAARLDDNKINRKCFLQALHFLRVYELSLIESQSLIFHPRQ